MNSSIVYCGGEKNRTTLLRWLPVAPRCKTSQNRKFESSRRDRWSTEQLNFTCQSNNVLKTGMFNRLQVYLSFHFSTRAAFVNVIFTCAERDGFESHLWHGNLTGQTARTRHVRTRPVWPIVRFVQTLPEYNTFEPASVRPKVAGIAQS